MHTFRRTLTVAAVAAVGTLTFALPAWAHTATFTRDCTQVHLHLEKFQASQDTPNMVDVFRDGTKIDTVTFNTTTADKDYAQTPDQAVTYEAKWDHTGPDRASGDEKMTLQPVADCKPATPPASPTDTATPTPSATPSSTAPVSSPVPASPTPSPKVEGAKLANTGAGNSVPLLVIGTVLVAGGVALTFVTRRRRSGSTSS